MLRDMLLEELKEIQIEPADIECLEEALESGTGAGTDDTSSGTCSGWCEITHK